MYTGTQLYDIVVIVYLFFRAFRSFFLFLFIWLFFLLSFIGYSNEVGEALRPVIPKKVVHLSYGIAIAYVIGDCIDKTMQTYKVIEVNMILSVDI